MNAPVLELEGTWEEVAAHAPELAGRKVRLTVLSEPQTLAKPTAGFRPGSGRSFLRHAGTWQGDDFEECLRAVIESRGSVQFQDES